MSARQFMQQLLDDPELRSEFTRDPRGAAARAGADLDDTDLQALSSMDWTADGERLRARANKNRCAG